MFVVREYVSPYRRCVLDDGVFIRSTLNEKTENFMRLLWHAFERLTIVSRGSFTADGVETLRAMTTAASSSPLTHEPLL